MINWKYYCDRRNIPYQIPAEYKPLCDKITEKHITVSDHHPEFWDDDKTDLVNPNNRDVKTRTIDATKMPENKLMELVADWRAVTIDRCQNTIREWADKNMGKRWKFTPPQEHFIYTILDGLEKKYGIK